MKRPVAFVAAGRLHLLMALMMGWVAPPDGTCATVIHAGSGGVGYVGSIDHWRGLGQASLSTAWRDSRG